MASSNAQFSRYYTYIKPVIQNPAVRSFAPYVFSLITIAILTVFALRPTISTITNLQKTIENDQQTLDGLTNKAKDLSEGKRNLENISSDKVVKINTALPAQPDVPQLISSLQTTLQKQSSISALQIQPLTIIQSSAPKSIPTLGEISFSYNIEGGFPQILTTLDSLSHSPRLLSISNLVISSQANGILNLSTTGKGYFLK